MDIFISAEKRGNIVGLHVPDFAVTRPLSVTGTDHVPNGDPVIPEQFDFFRVGGRRRRFEDIGKYFPEKVALKTVVFSFFQRYRAGHAS